MKKIINPDDIFCDAMATQTWIQDGEFDGHLVMPRKIYYRKILKYNWVKYQIVKIKDRIRKFKEVKNDK